MTENKYKYGVRPAVRFKHGSFRTGNYNGEGGKVAIIGAFPCVSPTLLRFTDLASARKELNITAGINDVLSENNPPVDETNSQGEYYYGAAALKWAFGEGTPVAGASEVLVCNITTEKYDSNGSVKCIDIYKKDEEGNPVPERDANGELQYDSDENIVYETKTIHDYNVTLRHGNDTQAEVTKYSPINYDKLKVACSKLRGEDFDLLIIAYPLEKEATGTATSSATTQDQYGNKLSEVADGLDTGIAGRLIQLRTFTHDSYGLRNPFGLGIGLRVPGTVTSNPAGTSDTSVVDSVINTVKASNIDTVKACGYLDIFSDPVHHAHSLYSMIFDDVKSPYGTGELNPVEAVSSYFCELASVPVDTSFTQRGLDIINGVKEELNYDPTYIDNNGSNTDGIKLVARGATMFECINRANNTWAVVNSRQPCGYDIAHLRTAAYIIKQIALSPFLGKINYDSTIESIDGVIASLKDAMIDKFPIVESIDHTVRRESSSCIRVGIKINFYGLIIDEVVYVMMEVI